MSAGRRSLAALLVVLCGLPMPSPAADDPGSLYQRSSRPQFNTKTLRGTHTRLVFEKMDIKNQAFIARVVRDREVLHELEFRFVPPPMELHLAQPFELAATLMTRPPPSQAMPERVAEVEVTLSPDAQFSVSGDPLPMPPTRFQAADLQAAGSAPQQPVTQRITCTLQGADANRVTCGYTVRLGWEEDLHEIHLVYVFRLKKGLWWARPAAGMEDLPKTGTSSPMVAALPATPWRDETWVRLFAVYLAEVNEAIRSQRGTEHAVDAWGREVGPASTLPLRPAGSWENPNHYVWAQDARYDGVPLSVRQFFAERTPAK